MVLDGIERALVVAPHPDDEALGCGGILKRLAAQDAETWVLTVAIPAPPLYPGDQPARSKEEALRAHAILGVRRSIFLEKPATLVSRTPHHELNEAILSPIRELQPQLVLVPFTDRMIDHRTIFDSAMTATRPVGAARCVKLLAAYEVISETPWIAPGVEASFIPTWFVDISRFIDAKIEAMAAYRSQVQEFPAPRSLEALRALALYRGSIAGMEYAECFQVLRQLS